MKTVITSGERSRLNFAEILAFSDLLKNLASRDITIRYKQTILGLMWALVRPCFNILVFGAISMLINRSGNVTDNFLKVGAGVIIWNLMISCITDASNSLVSNGNLLSKVYFPKIILPLSSTLVCLVDFAISFVIYLVVFFILIGFPGPQIFLIPVFIFMALVFCLGLGFIFSALNVKYRDVNFALPFFLQFAYYASPVFLTTAFYLDHLPVFFQKIFMLNPLVFILDGFRFCLYGTWEYFNVLYMTSSILLTIMLFWLGLRYFLKFEKSFADYI